MASHPCPRCKRLIPVGITYCEECRPIAEAQAAEAKERRRAFNLKKYNKAYNTRRAQDDPKYRQFRNSKPWKLTSKAKLQACGYKCEAKLPGCHRTAVEVHHIKPLKTPEGWEQRLEWENLMGVCVACHNILDNKTGKRKKEPGIIDLKEIIL